MRVAVVGLGKLGSPLAAVFASKGHKVYGCDLNTDFVDKLSKGIAPVEEKGLAALLGQSGQIRTTVDVVEATRQAEIIFIIVPTPSLDDGSFATSHIQSILFMLANAEQPNFYQTIVIVSTLSPGSMDTLVSAYESISGRKSDNNFGFIYSPEFIALGSVVTDLLNPSFVLIGEADTKSGDVLVDFYSKIHNAPVKRMSFVSAEIAKLGLNVALTQRISYANTISELCENYTGADAADVLDAIGLDRRIGSLYLCSGTAFGGPCFPRDCRAFKTAAKKAYCQAIMVEAGIRVNELQTGRIERIIDRTKGEKRIGILGLVYKEGTHIEEESAGLSLQKRLEKKGYKVSVCSSSQEDQLTEVTQFSKIIVVMTSCSKFRQLPLPAESEITIIDAWGIVDQSLLPPKVHYIRLGVKDVKGFTS